MSDVQTGEGLLDAESVSVLESFLGETTVNCDGILEFLGSFISRGVSEGRFTEKEAHHDLGIALWVAYACNNMDDYEHYYTAAEWLSRVEDLASGCGVWFYRYANALMYCGKPGMALEYCERGVREEPDYPWTYLTLGRLRAHFGDPAGARSAAARGLELVPDDHEFLTLLEDVDRGATIEEMEMHYIDPEADAELAEESYSSEYLHKRIAVRGIVCDRPALRALRDSLGIRAWSPDHPYCTCLMERPEGTVILTFMMNEAYASKLDPERVRRMIDDLDRLDSEARAHLLARRPDSRLTLFGLSIGPLLDGKLSYSESGTEDVRTVDFGSDLRVIEGEEGGPFAAMVLLSDDSWDPESILENMRSEWGIPVPDAVVDGDTIVGTIGPDLVAVSLMHGRVPGREAEEHAANNYLWPGAVEAAESHRAHLIVAVVNHGTDPVMCGMDFVKLVESCARLPNVVGVYHCGTVLEPSFFIDRAAAMRWGDIPVEDMVWFGMYRTSEGINAYTVGLNMFGRDEMEVIGARDRPSRVAAFLYDVTYHVLLNRAVFRDGDTIGFSDDQSLSVRRGPGVSVDGYSLKIQYPDSDI